jgi:uracil-DNA glycosylase
MSQINLPNSWLKYLEEDFSKKNIKKLQAFLIEQEKKKIIIFPEAQDYFKSLDLVELTKVKVVILGQDPYHGEGQAHGLSFSVQSGVRFPPSLRNIFKELKTDLNIETPASGDLTRWAEQGVLLLNSVLTVEKDRPASHQKKGWEELTDKIISVVNENCEHVVFILWGAYAQKKAVFVDRKKHLVLESVHPSPLSAHRGFFGSKPFSKANSWLNKNGINEINW